MEEIRLPRTLTNVFVYSYVSEFADKFNGDAPKIEFHQAKVYPSLRQAYLDSFLVNNPEEAVSRIVYWPFQRNDALSLENLGGFEEGHDMPMASIDYPTDFANDEKKPIVVGADSFEYGELTLSGVLRDHEYQHCRDKMHGFKVGMGNSVNVGSDNYTDLQEVTRSAVLETRAYLPAYIRAVSDFRDTDQQEYMELANIMFQGLCRFHKILGDINPENDFEKEVIKKQIEFVNWFFEETIENPDGLIIETQD